MSSISTCTPSVTMPLLSLLTSACQGHVLAVTHRHLHRHLQTCQWYHFYKRYIQSLRLHILGSRCKSKVQAAYLSCCKAWVQLGILSVAAHEGPVDISTGVYISQKDVCMLCNHATCSANIGSTVRTIPSHHDGPYLHCHNMLGLSNTFSKLFEWEHMCHMQYK